MNVSNEFVKYRSEGGTEDFESYKNRYATLKTEIGTYIIDYKNHRTEIGQLIHKYLDLDSRISFSQVSATCYLRSKKCEWFVKNSRDIVLRYIQQGTSFVDYLCDGGWTEGIFLAVKATSFAMTVTSTVKACQHALLIPDDAPTKTVETTDPDTGEKITITYIDHPEATLARQWTVGAVVSGVATAFLVSYSIKKVMGAIDVNVFFSKSEKDIIGPKRSFIGQLTFPYFYDWKWAKLKRQLSSNPVNWHQDRDLAKMICPISKDFMLFPVKDSCKHGHYFDYRSVRAFQLDPLNPTPFSCPLNRQRHNTGLLSVKFDKGMFDFIQSRLNHTQGEPFEQIQKRLLGIDDSDEDVYLEEDIFIDEELNEV